MHTNEDHCHAEQWTS